MTRDTDKTLRQRLALRAALVYLILGWAWIAGSEYLLYAYGLQLPAATQISLIKGAVFILISAVLIGWLIHVYSHRAGRYIEWLLLTRHQYRSLFAHHPEPVYVLDTSGVLLEANEATAGIAGVPVSQIIGKHYRHFLTPEILPETSRHFEEAARGKAQHYISRLRQPDGTRISIEVTNIPLYEEDKVAGVLGIARDITEEERNQERLEASEARFRSLFEYSMDGILLTRPDGGIITANPAACKMLQRSETEIIRLGRKGLLNEADPALKHMLEERRRTGSARGVLRMLRGDGNWITVEISSVVFHDEHGKERTSIILHDLTERQEAEELIRASEARFRIVAEQTGQIIYEHDPRLGTTIFAGSCEAVLGYGQEALAGMSARERVALVHPDDLPTLLETLHTTMEKGGSHQLEYRIRHAEGHMIDVQERGSFLPEHGRLYGVLQDVSDRQQLIRRLEERERRLEVLTRQQETVLDSLPAHIALLDHGGIIRFVNRAWRRFGEKNGFRYANHGIDCNYIDICDSAEGPYSEGSADVARAIRKIVNDERAGFSTDYPCHGPDRHYWFRTQITPVPQEGGTGALVTHFDITEQVEAQYRLRLVAAAFASADEAMVICDRDFHILDVNAAFERQTGQDRASVLGRMPSFMEMPQQAEALREGVRRHHNWHGELLIRRTDGHLFPARANVSEVRSPDDDSLNYVIDFNDLSEQHDYERKIDYLSYHDNLTGLPNLSALRQLFAEQIENVRDVTGRQLALVYFDLDRFKVVNETYGHSTGDRLLQDVVRRLQPHCGEQDYLVRPGGDELILVLEGMQGHTQVGRRVERMLESLARPFEFEHRKIYTSASAGICLYPNDGESLEELLRKSDAALANAKQRGRAQAAIFEAGMNAEIEERLHIERELRSAVSGNELRLHFQPSVDLHDGRITGFEALVRWESPQLGLVPPGKFISVAEESGLILEIGQWVIEESCRMLSEWQEQGLEPGMVAINLSPVQFAHADVLAQFRDALRKYAIHPGQLRVEITEGVLVMEPEWTVQALEGLQKMGISVALDDFGTGYSSMAYLQRFPIQYLKLDRSFITSLFESDKNAHIVLSVIELAHRLGMAVVAEGIEHAREAERLREWGCEFAQGYHFSRPVPASDVPAMLRTGSRLPEP